MKGTLRSRKKTSGLLASVTLLAALLTGCASPQVPGTCPERTAIPAELQKPSLPSAEAFSQRVSSFFKRLEKGGESQRPTKTQ